MTNSQIDTTNESQEVSPFPEGESVTLRTVKTQLDKMLHVHEKNKNRIKIICIRRF